MAVKYLKKRKLINMFKTILPDDYKFLSEAFFTYRFYRGSEWLDFDFADASYGYYNGRLYVCKNVNYVRLSVFTINSENETICCFENFYYKRELMDEFSLVF